MFRTILICMILTMTAGTTQAAKPIVGTCRRQAASAAKAAIEACGYRNVRNLTATPSAIGRQRRKRGGVEIAVVCSASRASVTDLAS